MKNEAPQPGKPQGVLGDLVKIESMIQLGIALPVGCMLGWFAGSWADRHLQTHWIGVVGILLGAVGGFIKIFTTAKQYMKDAK